MSFSPKDERWFGRVSLAIALTIGWFAACAGMAVFAIASVGMNQLFGLVVYLLGGTALWVLSKAAAQSIWGTIVPSGKFWWFIGTSLGIYCSPAPLVLLFFAPIALFVPNKKPSPAD